MNASTKIPADRFLDLAISALASTDISAISTLASCAPTVAKPASIADYPRNRDVYAALVEETGRNLRLLLRAAEQGRANFYISSAR